jgi:peptidoglycan hydrolase FlgJ
MRQTLTVPMQQAIVSYGAAAKAKPGTREAKAHSAAQNFEATFLQNMLENMSAGLGAEGPLGSGNAGGGAWRGFLLEEMSKGMAKSPGGGLGIAPHVYREMISLQEKRG